MCNVHLIDLFLCIKINGVPKTRIKIKVSRMTLWLPCIPCFIKQSDIGFLSQQLNARVKPTGKHTSATSGHKAHVVLAILSCVMRNDETHIVQFNQSIHSSQELMNIRIGVFFAIKEVNERIQHHNVGLMESDFFADHVNVAVFKQVFAQSTTHNEVLAQSIDVFRLGFIRSKV